MESQTERASHLRRVGTPSTASRIARRWRGVRDRRATRAYLEAIAPIVAERTALVRELRGACPGADARADVATRAAAEDLLDRARLAGARWSAVTPPTHLAAVHGGLQRSLNHVVEAARMLRRGPSTPDRTSPVSHYLAQEVCEHGERMWKTGVAKLERAARRSGLHAPAPE